jgi:acetyltransferase-like isoleucine patch superfamily enzyme
MDMAVDKLSMALRNTMREQISSYGWNIGEHSYGTPNVMDPEWGHLKIGRFCSISMHVTIVLGNHRTDTVTTYPFKALAGLWPGAESVGPDHEGRGGVQIGHDVWIGFGAVILPGARIGNGCVIGANAVVRSVVPDYAIVGGNPAKILRYRFDQETINRLLASAWWDWDEATLTKFMPLLASGDPGRFLAAVEAAA